MLWANISVTFIGLFSPCSSPYLYASSSISSFSSSDVTFLKDPSSLPRSPSSSCSSSSPSPSLHENNDFTSSPSTRNALNANASMSPTYPTGSCAFISNGAIPPYPLVSASKNRRVTSVLLPAAISSSACRRCGRECRRTCRHLRTTGWLKASSISSPSWNLPSAPWDCATSDAERDLPVSVEEVGTDMFPEEGCATPMPRKNCRN
mmetsp:Transcript_48421/g.102978  ORF Transcript_48421/g.102978 Transcript_48421/m.102978 type:complete len:206 (-) Transcript_48421:1053-1670(-)